MYLVYKMFKIKPVIGVMEILLFVPINSECVQYKIVIHVIPTIELNADNVNQVMEFKVIIVLHA